MTSALEWGIPNWLRTDEYPSPQSRSATFVWAWEFLRRNPGYRDFWSTKVAPFLDERGRHPEGWAHGDELEQNYLLGTPCPPWLPFDEKLPLFFRKGPRTVQAHHFPEDMMPRIPLAEHEVAFVVDLSVSIGDQIDGILRAARREQQELIRRKVVTQPRPARKGNRYLTYLRILDAYEVGVRPNDIAKALFPQIDNDFGLGRRQSKTLDDYHRSACRLRDSGFRALIAA